MSRQMEEFKGCTGEIDKFKTNGTTIQCQEEGPHSCEKIFERVGNKLENTDEAFIGTIKCLTDIFRGDERVEDMLINRGVVGTARNKLSYELGQDVPRQALAITNHEDFKIMRVHEINKEIALTLLHEDEHLGGVGGKEEEEKKAERKARERLKW